jgi:hypothetical protein
MAGPLSKDVFVGAPDQATTGAILSGPVGTPLPTGATATSTTLNAALKASGYIGETGVRITPSRSTTQIRDWSRKAIRTLLESFDGTLAWEHMALDEQSVRNYFGDENVEVFAATTTLGTRMALKLRGDALTEKCWVFRIKDGLRKVVVVVPNGTITEQGEIPLVANDAIRLPVVMTTAPDADGNNLYIYTNDGLVAAA